jgi:tetratricopeptide (TPR) repeat protein
MRYSVQSVCEDLANDNYKKFDYIAFISAKDRFYNYFTGTVQPIEGSTSTFDGFIRSLNQIVFNEDVDDIERIVNIKNKLLIVIDDYETFLLEEKAKIENFIRSLNINYHKVIVTTRANLIIGDEYQTNELDAQETRSFLVEILRSEFNSFHAGQLESELIVNDRYKMVHNITSGRPLFVYQFAYIWMQSGTIDSALARDIKQEKQAIDFLYGRIYDYLSTISKDIFVAIGQIVADDDLTNLIDKVRYILNLEENDKFQDGIRDLEKLRIIEILEGKFFRVYSKEILQAMSTHFSRRNDSFRGGVISRLQQVTKDKRLDNDRALLQNANTARVSRSEEEVISLYRNVINRSTNNTEVRMQAVFNLADFLFNARGKKDEAVKLFKDYKHLFNEEASFTRLYAVYCWTTGRKQDSIEILSDFCARKPRQYKEDRSVKFEMLGLLVMYRSISAIQQKEELKEKKRFDEINSAEHLMQSTEVKNLFIDICNRHGNFLVHDLRQLEDLDVLSSSARQNVIAGLYQYVNINIRLNKFQEAVSICEFVIQNFPAHFSDQFKNKIYFCRSRLTYKTRSTNHGN